MERDHIPFSFCFSVCPCLSGKGLQQDLMLNSAHNCLASISIHIGCRLPPISGTVTHMMSMFKLQTKHKSFFFQLVSNRQAQITGKSTNPNHKT